MGIYFQITAGSIAGKFGRRIQRFAFRLLEEGLCHFIASDAHNPKSRAFFLKESRTVLEMHGQVPQTLNTLFHDNACAVVKGDAEVRTIRVAKPLPVSRNIFRKRT